MVKLSAGVCVCVCKSYILRVVWQRYRRVKRLSPNLCVFLLYCYKAFYYDLETDVKKNSLKFTLPSYQISCSWFILIGHFTSVLIKIVLYFRWAFSGLCVQLGFITIYGSGFWFLLFNYLAGFVSMRLMIDVSTFFLIFRYLSDLFNERLLAFNSSWEMLEKNCWLSCLMEH